MATHIHMDLALLTVTCDLNTLWRLVSEVIVFCEECHTWASLDIQAYRIASGSHFQALLELTAQVMLLLIQARHCCHCSSEISDSRLSSRHLSDLCANGRSADPRTSRQIKRQAMKRRTCCCEPPMRDLLASFLNVVEGRKGGEKGYGLTTESVEMSYSIAQLCITVRFLPKCPGYYGSSSEPQGPSQSDTDRGCRGCFSHAGR